MNFISNLLFTQEEEEVSESFESCESIDELTFSKQKLNKSLNLIQKQKYKVYSDTQNEAFKSGRTDISQKSGGSRISVERSMPQHLDFDTNVFMRTGRTKSKVSWYTNVLSTNAGEVHIKQIGTKKLYKNGKRISSSKVNTIYNKQ